MSQDLYRINYIIREKTEAGDFYTDPMTFAEVHAAAKKFERSPLILVLGIYPYDGISN